MAKRGRKPKPTALKILEGVAPCRINGVEPKAPPGRPEIPDIVLVDPVAARKWEEMVPKLEGMGILSAVDGDALALYCVAYSHWIAAEEDIRRNGFLTETAIGTYKTNPHVNVSKEAFTQMAKILSEFGMTPSSRGRIKVEAPAKDELSEFLEKRKA